MKCSLLAATMLIGAINTTVVVGGQTDFSTYRLRDASLNTVVLCSWSGPHFTGQLAVGFRH